MRMSTDRSPGASGRPWASSASRDRLLAMAVPDPRLQALAETARRFAEERVKPGFLERDDTRVLDRTLIGPYSTYPRTSVAPEALLALIRSYRVLGYEEDVRETCGYLRRFHADTPGAAEACPAGADTAQG